MFSLKGKNAVITGGGSGIGRAIAELFAAQGATVHVVELNLQGAEETIHKIIAEGGQGYAWSCNVADQQQVLVTVGAIIEKRGAIDILVNSAGIAHVGNIEKTSPDDFDRIFHVNVKGVYNTMFSVIPGMKEKRRGVILNLASVASSVGIPDRFAYSMSKGAVLTMTLSVAKDYLQDNIRCNCISPARVHTAFVDGFLKANYPGKEDEMFAKLSKTQPIGRMGRPDEVAALALYLCADEASFVTGCDYPVDGGFIRLNN
ncbi:SDR family NAD(P)-dependent oxidoreductase [Pseudochryseolinea flava]|uniref:Short-chain dehydrogenase n=1 Tax=Pseudochryseolinea flava TaxID=2059302 RepID=A0A364XY67_9BACT|nr:glucose 1-dehydrogenase [Pseudochryseolinea flava]RAV99204.1 short-chain dehydrogenase [Pseudochryseolinea flava]